MKRYSNAVELGRPFRALNNLGPLFPGRCPGLALDVPLGLRGRDLSGLAKLKELEGMLQSEALFGPCGGRPPLQGFEPFGAIVPRALPWAGVGRPFGAEGQGSSGFGEAEGIGGDGAKWKVKTRLAK